MGDHKDDIFGYETANDFSYNVLKNNAWKNRRTPTVAEQMLWENIRSNKLGIHFRRQHVIGNYIVDFVCMRNRLVIEVDGKYHNGSQQIEADNYRTWYLAERGYRVIRFTNEEVTTDIEKVITTIIHNL